MLPPEWTLRRGGVIIKVAPVHPAATGGGLDITLARRDVVQIYNSRRLQGVLKRTEDNKLSLSAHSRARWLAGSAGGRIARSSSCGVYTMRFFDLTDSPPPSPKGKRPAAGPAANLGTPKEKTGTFGVPTIVDLCDTQGEDDDWRNPPPAECVDLLDMSDSDDDDDHVVEDLRRLGGLVVTATEEPDRRRQSLGKSNPPPSSSAHGSGVGYGGNSSYTGGKGRGGGLGKVKSKGGMSGVQPKGGAGGNQTVAKANATQTKDDKKLAGALDSLADFVIRKSGPTRSPMGSRATDALRGACLVMHTLVMNESREDWSLRVDLYIAVLKLVETLVKRSSPARLVLEHTMASRSIADALGTIKTQSRVFLRLNSGNGVTEADDRIHAGVEKACRSVETARDTHLT